MFYAIGETIVNLLVFAIAIIGIPYFIGTYLDKS